MLQAEELIAFKWWNLSKDKLLISPFSGKPLKNSVLTVAPDLAPSIKNNHGILAFKNLSLASDLYYDLVIANGLKNGPDTFVFTAVSLFGKIVEHEYAYRAQKCVLRSIVVPHPHNYPINSKRYDEFVGRVTNNLSKAYQCSILSSMSDFRRSFVSA